MDFVGKEVKHRKYGVGHITAQDIRRVSVKFDSLSETKQFEYPDCFKTFLKLSDNDATVEISKVIEKKENENRVKREISYHEKKIEDINKGNNKTKSGSVKLSPFSSAEAFCESYKRYLQDEVSFLKRGGGKRQKLFDGAKVEVKNSLYIYTFETEDELNYPEDSPIILYKNEGEYSGSIIGCDSFNIIIATRKDFGDSIDYLEFSAEPWRLMTYLCDGLDVIAKNPSDMVKDLICNGYKAIDYSNHNITMGQDHALEMAESQPITFIWGPPGTGKTETLARIAINHMNKGNRVLMLSYSNVSVDGAIMRVEKLYEDLKPGIAVRYGYPKMKELLQHDFLTSYNLAIHNHPDLLKERLKLVDERKVTSRTSQRYIQISARLRTIKSLLSEEEKSSVERAKFVATTVSKAIADKVIREADFDVVIFDEASMSYVPQIIFGSSLAKKHFICMGDFRQLPPIVQSSKESILNVDIFQYCGITSAVEDGAKHNWLCMLNTQYRMHPEISDFASNTMYNGLLKSFENMEINRRSICESGPVAGKAIGFADISGMMSVCNRTADGSRINVLSALISFSLALEAAKNNNVGIITPYHAQSRLLHAMARDASETLGLQNKISCATVHQFQGSEKDVIIFDATECYRMPFPGTLLTSTANNYANRLFNVALTRAKGKFIGVANIDYMEQKNLSKNLILRQLIDNQKNSTSCIGGRKVFPKFEKTFDDLFSASFNSTISRKFISDIDLAKNEIRIDIPDKPADDRYVCEIYQALLNAKNRGIKVIIRAENKKNLPSGIKSLAIENTYVSNPVSIIDKKIVWFGMPGSDAKFISEGITIPTEYRPMIRFEGSNTAVALYGFLEMNRTVDQSKMDMDSKVDNLANYIAKNKKCPLCGRPMQLRKGNKSRYYISCSGYPDCKKTELVDVDMVDDYLYRNGKSGQHCPKCHCSLEAKLGQFGVYVQCCGLSRHTYSLEEI